MRNHQSVSSIAPILFTQKASFATLKLWLANLGCSNCWSIQCPEFLKDMRSGGLQRAYPCPNGRERIPQLLLTVVFLGIGGFGCSTTLSSSNAHRTLNSCTQATPFDPETRFSKPGTLSQKSCKCIKALYWEPGRGIRTTGRRSPTATSCCGSGRKQEVGFAFLS